MTSMELTPALLINFLVLVLGTFIKFEIHDIKSRIMRLENLFLRPKGDLNDD